LRAQNTKQAAARKLSVPFAFLMGIKKIGQMRIAFRFKVLYEEKGSIEPNG